MAKNWSKNKGGKSVRKALPSVKKGTEKELRSLQPDIAKGNMPLDCPHCGKRIKQRKNMNRHVWTMHGIQAKGRKSRSKCVAEPKSRKAPAQQKDAPSQGYQRRVSNGLLKKHIIKGVRLRKVVINEGSMYGRSNAVTPPAPSSSLDVPRSRQASPQERQTIVAADNDVHPPQMDAVQPPPPTASHSGASTTPSASQPDVIPVDVDHNGSVEATRVKTEPPAESSGMCGKCEKVVNLTKHRVTGHFLKECPECGWKGWTLARFIKHTDACHASSYNSKIFRSKPHLLQYIKNVIHKENLTKEPSRGKGTKVWTCPFYSHATLACPAFVKWSPGKDGTHTVYFCKDHLHVLGDEGEVVHDGYNAMEGIVEENVHVETTETTSTIEAAEMDAQMKLIHKALLHVLSTHSKVDLAKDLDKFNMYFYQTIHGSILQHLVNNEPEHVQLMNQIRETEHLPLYADSSEASAENRKRSVKVVTMLAKLADTVKTPMEVEKLLSMLRNLSTVTGLGEKKRERGELVVNKFNLGKIKTEPSEIGQGKGGEGGLYEPPRTSHSKTPAPGPSSRL